MRGGPLTRSVRQRRFGGWRTTFHRDPRSHPAKGQRRWRREIADTLKAKVGEQDTIYLIARAGESGPPLAAARVSMGAFPLPFGLDSTWP